MQYESLTSLANRLKNAESIIEINEILDEQKSVGEFVSKSPILRTYLQGLSPKCSVVIKSILAIGQGQTIFSQLDKLREPFEALREFVFSMLDVQDFYQPIGGIVGYHVEMLHLIHRKDRGENAVYKKPKGFDISNNPLEYIRKGIEDLPQMAEVYPVGGAGDRLNLQDPITDEPLPAAQLMFEGRNLLEGLIRDLQAREYLYKKIFGISLITPIVLMTSHEKHNHQRIVEVCEEKKWFFRSKENFFFINQPLVPLITIKGEWVTEAPLRLMKKPGGHGALWKLALDSGAFEWLKEKERSFALIRQINNPIAGVDSGLLAFSGVGRKHQKVFGFESCPRLLNTHEGMLVLKEKDSHYNVSNIEYTEFALHGIEDIPESKGSQFSVFPTNTNILFVDLEGVEKAIKKNPIPGLMINMKTKHPSEDIACGRLESMMQSLADEIVDKNFENLRTYLTDNERVKTISVTKQARAEGGSIIGTPEGAFVDHQKNAHFLFKNICKMEVGKEVLISYHPALGPLYSVICQKIQGGSLSFSSELRLEIAELYMKNCQIDGSLLIEADSIEGGRCYLSDVVVKNRGIDRSKPNVGWKSEIYRKEKLNIVLNGRSEFIAKNVIIDGSHQIEVPNGHRMLAFSHDGRVHFRLEKLAIPSFDWSFCFDEGDQIVLSMKQIGESSPIC